MSFRIEKKIAINKDKFFDLKKFLIEKKFKRIFKDRVIYSCYLDNQSLKMYNDSIEGIVPRKKLRIRSYNDLFKNEVFLEKKISSVEGRFKSTEQIQNFDEILQKGYFDHEYGICFPQIIIRYIRSYFSKNNLRITIDKKISFSSYKKSLKNIFFYNFDDYDCAEIKCQNLEEIENLNLNHFLTVRNSKYCIGMNHILKNSDIYTEPL
tara:strand:+ start:133 stop:756 length:624 start_codon:yes stop_codon:yes gene_type:complete